MRAAFLFCLPLTLVLLAASRADDWPQWLGPNRDSVRREDGIVERFPEDGLPVKWRTPFIDGSTIYGCDVETGALTAVRSSDGKRLWETLVPTSGGQRRDRYGTAFLVKHGNRFILLSETGDLILAKLSPEKYEEISRFHLLDATNQTFGRPVVWSHPALANRCVYARNDKEVVCVNLAKGQ